MQSTNTISSMDAKKKRRLVTGFLFLTYFIVLFYFLFFSEKMGRTYSERAYHYNLVPLKEISRFITYADVLGMKTVLLNIVGNVVAFVPFGIFIPIYTTRGKKLWMTTFYSFELSLLVEVLQLITKVGSFDVDDLILNTLGGMLGYLIYKFTVYFFRGEESGKTT